MLAGPGEVMAAASAAVGSLSSVARSSSVSGVRGSRAGWAAALGELQRVADVVAAAQDAVVVALAAVEEEWSEDGTVGEVHRAAGHVAVDAAAIVSGVLCVSAVQAERRVRSAVRWAADGPEGSVSATGLGGLHAAMAAGRVDGYRASVVAEELEAAPAEVAASVVAAVEVFFDVEDAPALRRRCRRVLARMSPDLLRQRSVRARAESRLERWASEPGVDCWHGTFPSEEAARAWAAVDALARRYVADGTCAQIGRARAKALTDLVEGSAGVETVVTLVVPHDLPEVPGERGPVVPGDAHGPGGGHVDGGAGGGRGGRGGGGGSAAADGAARPVPGGPDGQAPCVLADSAPPGPADPAVRGRGRSTRGQPGVSATPVAGVHGQFAQELVEVAGVRAGEPLLVERAWLSEAVAATRAAGRDRAGRVRVVAGDRVTGALVDPGGVLGTGGYRPGTGLAALVRARDGRCRFPGCQVAARFCDLDHVRAWPGGPTAAVNLLCLCRRHHRVKQRPGWRVTLAADGTATWTDPTGRTRTTVPVDALHPLVLPAETEPAVADPAGADPAGGDPAVGDPAGGEATGGEATGGEPVRRLTQPAPDAGPRLVVPDGPHSFLEHRLEHHVARHWRHVECRVDLRRIHGEQWRVATAPRAHRRVRPRRHRPPPDEAPPF